MEQQLAIEFAPLKNRMSWHWTLEAVRRAWPTCVRFMTREKMLTRCGWTEPRHMAQTLLKSYGVTRQTIRDIAKLPQRSPEWYLTREGFVLLEHGIFRGCLISSSTVGEWLGDKYGYKSNDKGEIKLHYEVLYGKLFNDADPMTSILTQRGTAMEPLIMAQLMLVLLLLIYYVFGDYTVQIMATEVGLEVCYDDPNIGVSSDGRLSILVPSCKKVFHFGNEMKCKGDPWSDPYDQIKPEYFDQTQLTMYVQKYPYYFFTCHSARGFTVEMYAFQHAWFMEQLKVLRRRYWGWYWPTFVMKSLGMLSHGDILPCFYNYVAPPLDNKSVANDMLRHYGVTARAPLATALDNFDDNIDYDDL